MLRNASSFDEINFSNVFHLKQTLSFFIDSSSNSGRTSVNFSHKLTLSATSYIVSTFQIQLIKSIAFAGQKPSIHGILSDLSQTIDK